MLPFLLFIYLFSLHFTSSVFASSFSFFPRWFPSVDLSLKTFLSSIFPSLVFFFFSLLFSLRFFLSLLLSPPHVNISLSLSLVLLLFPHTHSKQTHTHTHRHTHTNCSAHVKLGSVLREAGENLLGASVCLFYASFSSKLLTYFDLTWRRYHDNHHIIIIIIV